MVPDFPPLRKILHGPLTINEAKLYLSAIWSGHQWDWKKLFFEIPHFSTGKANNIRSNPCIGTWDALLGIQQKLSFLY